MIKETLSATSITPHGFKELIDVFNHECYSVVSDYYAVFGEVRDKQIDAAIDGVTLKITCSSDHILCVVDKRFTDETADGEQQYSITIYRKSVGHRQWDGKSLTFAALDPIITAMEEEERNIENLRKWLREYTRNVDAFFTRDHFGLREKAEQERQYRK